MKNKTRKELIDYLESKGVLEIKGFLLSECYTHELIRTANYWKAQDERKEARLTDETISGTEQARKNCVEEAFDAANNYVEEAWNATNKFLKQLDLDLSADKIASQVAAAAMANLSESGSVATTHQEENNRMNVLFASYHCCIRVVKQALALGKAGVNVLPLQRSIANEGMLPALPPSLWYGSRDSYAKQLQFPGIDLIHCHNEPDWLVHAAKKARPDLPVVYDCHDLDSQRRGKANPDENRSMVAADGYIFPSQAYLDGATEYHKLGPDKPKLVLHSMCNEDFRVQQPLPRRRGIVYEGSAIIPPENAGKSYPNYRDYRVLAQALHKMDIPFTIYGVQHPDHLRAYSSLGVECPQVLPYDHLLPHLSKFDWGFCGCMFPNPQWDKAMPNKLFEYIAAGIPVMVYNASEAGKFVTKHKLGVVIRSLDEIPDVYHLHEVYRTIVQETRHRFTMESQILKLVDFYQEVLACRQ